MRAEFVQSAYAKGDGLASNYDLQLIRVHTHQSFLDYAQVYAVKPLATSDQSQTIKWEASLRDSMYNTTSFYDKHGGL